MSGNRMGLTSDMSFIQREKFDCKALGLVEVIIVYIADGQKAIHVSSQSTVAAIWNGLSIRFF